ncbi:uncharacterized protein LOC131601626 [Vicia villosa]|uniref:uncharacterized protein LOC131601626 n=1 Tax=Vicia villosa TaxID=3911 RepID=UPI00273B831F|nr:uncharacterized protein LOC131601626 [Vicia villosa]XP_058729476.1 uncharacterized protein LOC131601626 [Vicia villosa]XP_058729477.1 uncharacterized protein LOC131601626 [Vicia villosa]XP_058729478.1 uncharacterized protein LOC131601626 [Vicia villosa]
MGFDNECIINIQSLAGEYFCPVCRLLVFPNEALQSQCTHLYCKPCLTYVVSTTRACPYDGYLVTEADSKPLVETNKALAETIGKIAVHCLYHRSGCSWQGTLSECTSHCSGCTFGNSPVVCNRCGIQIVHSQVQEHAQTCSGVQGQVQQGGVAQDPSATSAFAVASTDQNQVAAPVAATASQPVTSQSVVATSAAGHVSNQLPNPASQTQALGQAAVQPTAEQWYQQQQYQQYYQQYPGQDPYQQQYQQYYPYQQSAVPQYQQAYVQPQPQTQPQPQSQPQAQPQAQGMSQPVSHVQTPAAPQSQNHMQVHQQPQQLQPAVQPHGQTGHPPGHGQAFPQPQSYPYSQVQPHSGQPQQNMQIPPYQQPHPQMQHPQPQNQQPVQKNPVPQPQVHPQMQSNAPVQHPSQPQMQSHLPMPPNVQAQGQNTMSHAVTGHHSYPQPMPHQNMPVGAPQSNMHLNPQSGQLQGQHPVQMQNQFPQQTPMMRPNQSHAMYPNQQLALLPSSVQGQSTPPLQPQPGYTPNQQTGQTNQRPILQPVQQILPQQPFAQHQTPMPSHLRPQGPVHSFPKHAYPQSKGNTTLSQNAVGRPSIPNHAGHVQPFVHSANTFPVRPGNQNMLVGTNNQVQSRAPEPIERQGDVTEQQTESASGKIGKNELKSEKETSLKSTEVGSKQNSEDPHSVKTLGPNANALENGDTLNKNVGKGEASESTEVQHNSNEHSVVQGNEIQGGPPLKTETKLSESETDKLHSDDINTPRPPSGADNPAPAVSQTNGVHGPGIGEYRGMQSGGLVQPSHPGSFQQRSSAILMPHPTGPNQPLSAANSSTLLRNHGTAPALHSGQALNSMDNFQPTMFKQPHGSDVQFNIPGRSFQHQPHGPPAGPYNQVHEPPFHPGASNLSRSGGPQFGAPPHGDMHGGMTANFPPHAPEGFGVQDERFKSFQIPSQPNIDRREFEDDLKKFPRHPFDAEPGSKYGNHSLGLHEAGKRPIVFHDDAIKKPASTLHPGHLGPGPGYGMHPMDGMAPRSPGSEYTDMPSRRFGPLSGGLISKSGIDDFEGRNASRFGDSVGNAFRDGRFPHPPSHLHRDEFDGFGNFRMGEHPRRGNFTGQDEFAGHFQRGEHLGPHKFPRHLRLEERIGFGDHPGHMRAFELSGSRSFESFTQGSRPGHPQLGEPGFRSSFSLTGFNKDAGFLTGDTRPFDNPRRRKAISTGWCRICKIDCETVEGLELHSQTREHQKMAMDVVKAIKQNAKKHKLIPSEQSSVEDGNKTRATGFEGHGNKH